MDERCWTIDVCGECGERLTFTGNWCSNLHPEAGVLVEVVPTSERDRLADQLARSRALTTVDIVEFDRCRAENERLREVLNDAWVEAHQNHRATNPRDVKCSMHPCPQLRAFLVAPASGEIGKTT